MPNETNPSNLLEVRTNSHLSMEYDTGKFHPFVELILIGYRARYDLDLGPDNSGKVKHTMEAHTSRVLVTRASAEALRRTMDMVIAHIDSLATIAEPLNQIVMDKMNGEPTDQEPVAEDNPNQD